MGADRNPTPRKSSSAATAALSTKRNLEPGSRTGRRLDWGELHKTTRIQGRDPVMRITWYGHAAFLIETQGLRIILDPYRSPDSGGYLPIDEPADLVVVSHENDRYHSHLGQIVPPFELVRALELPAGGAGSTGSVSRRCTSSRRRSGCPKTRSRSSTSGPRTCTWSSSATWAIRSTEDGARPVPRGGHRAGRRGRPADDRLPRDPPLLDAIGPRLVLPMHYKTPKINLNIQPLERFLEVVPEIPSCGRGRARSR